MRTNGNLKKLSETETLRSRTRRTKLNWGYSGELVFAAAAALGITRVCAYVLSRIIT